MKQLRICILGDYDNYLSYFLYGCLEGFIRAGQLCRPVPFFGHPIDQVKRQILWFKPHIVCAHMLFGCSRYHSRDSVFIMLRELRKEGIFIVYHNGDARKDPRYPHDISDIVDLGLLNQSNLKHYESIWKIPCIRWPYMCLYQKEIAKPVDMYRCDIAFTGELSRKGVHAERTAFIGELTRLGLNVRIFPTNETGNTRFQTAELAASAKMVLGMQMERHLKGYLDVRPFQYIGAGAVYLHDKCDQMDEIFNDGSHYFSYDKNDPKTVKELYRIMTKVFDNKISRIPGFLYCQKKHSTLQRVEAIICKYNEMK